MTAARRFPLRAVLAVTTGLPLTELAEQQALLSHMTGTPLAVHQVERARDVCEKYLRDQYGWLQKMQPPAGVVASKDKLRRWVLDREKERGHTLSVQVLPGGVYTPRDPIVEFMQGAAR